MNCKCYADMSGSGKPILIKCLLCKAAPALYDAVKWVLEDYQDTEDDYTRIKVSTHTQLLKALAKAGK